MELDLAGMHQLAAGQGIDPETLDAALSEALRLAYLKTPHAAKHARVELDPRAGSFTVGLRMRLRSNRPRIIRTLRRLWARNTMTLRVTLDAWPQPPHVRSSASCSAKPRTTRCSARSQGRRAS